jgi:peptidoglycan/LPS O-acetylase OafA/YrhL
MSQRTPYKHYHSVDIIRGLTALLICLYHFINHVDSTGSLFDPVSFIRVLSKVIIDVVFVFFVISGFVVPLSMARQGYKIKYFFHYLLRRWLRVEIPYLASIVLILATARFWATRNGTDLHLNESQIVHHITYTVGFFGHEWFNEIYWTLAIEFQFYLLIGLSFPLFIHDNDWIKYGSLFLFGISGLFFPSHLFIFHYAPLFVLGILYFLQKGNRHHRLVNMIFFAVFMILLMIVHGWLVSFYVTLALLAFEFLKVFFSGFKFLGKIAYSFYLIHGAVGGTFLLFFSEQIDSLFGRILLFLFATAFAILGSYLFFLLIEKPSWNWSKKINISKIK